MADRSLRQTAGRAIAALGGLILLSALVQNPWVRGLAMGPEIVDVKDVLSRYFFAALAIGACTVGIGLAVARGGRPWLDSFVLLFLPLAFVILFDRFLLTRYNLTIWVFDPEIHYTQRPDAMRTLAQAGRPDDIVRINRWGHHDDDFPREKAADEFRGLMLGDSVTMGFGVTYPETFSAQLEVLLAERDRRYATHQIINTGVHGYAAFQERVILERSLAFDPDFVAVGFCMNDVLEPMVVNRDHGGVGLDYHGVLQSSSRVAGWLVNETGFGRLVQSLMRDSKNYEADKRWELFSTRDLAAKPVDDPEFAEAWEIQLRELEKLYAVARENDKPVVLLIFPFAFQLADEALRTPQAILAEHAARHGVDVVDFTDLFAAAVFADDAALRRLRAEGASTDEIEAAYRREIDAYFFDVDHFTQKGHAIVARRLLDYLLERGFVGAAPRS